MNELPHYEPEDLESKRLDAIRNIQGEFTTRLMATGQPGPELLPPALVRRVQEYMQKFGQWKQEKLPSNDPNVVSDLSQELQEQYRQFMIEGALMLQEQVEFLENVGDNN